MSRRINKNRILSLTLKNKSKIYLYNFNSSEEVEWSYQREDAFVYTSSLLDDRVKTILGGNCTHVFR